MPLRCLVVDDDHDVAEALSALLTALGLDVRVEYSGLAAIESAIAFQPRIVVLDIDMPGLNGFQTVMRLKQQGWSRTSLFVAHTGMRRVATDGHLFKDFDHVLTKGSGAESLEAILKALHAAN